MDDNARELNPDELARLTSSSSNAKTGRDPQSPEELAQALMDYRQSIEQEFAGIDPDSEDTSQAARKTLFELIPEAGVTIKHLMLHSDSDSVRANMAKFVYTEALRVARAADTVDDFDKLIASLQTGGGE